MAEVTEPVPRIRALVDPAVEPPWGGSWHQLDPEIETLTAAAEITFDLTDSTYQRLKESGNLDELSDVIRETTDEG